MQTHPCFLEKFKHIFVCFDIIQNPAVLLVILMSILLGCLLEEVLAESLDQLYSGTVTTFDTFQDALPLLLDGALVWTRFFESLDRWDNNRVDREVIKPKVVHCSGGGQPQEKANEVIEDVFDQR